MKNLKENYQKKNSNMKGLLIRKIFSVFQCTMEDCIIFICVKAFKHF